MNFIKKLLIILYLGISTSAFAQKGIDFIWSGIKKDNNGDCISDTSNQEQIKWDCVDDFSIGETEQYRLFDPRHNSSIETNTDNQTEK